MTTGFPMTENLKAQNPGEKFARNLTISLDRAAMMQFRKQIMRELNRYPTG